MSYLETNKTVKSYKKVVYIQNIIFVLKLEKKNKKMFFTNIFFEISDANH